MLAALRTALSDRNSGSAEFFNSLLIRVGWADARRGDFALLGLKPLRNVVPHIILSSI
jgi:hypothetical protein